MPDPVAATTPTTPTATTPTVETPAPTPTSGATDVPASGAEPEGSFNFESFDKDFEVGDELEEPVVEAPAAKAPEPKQPAAAKASPAVPEKPVAAPAPAKPAETPPVQPAVAAPEAAKPPVQPTAPAVEATPEQRRAQYNEWRNNSEKKLENLYKLSAEDAEKMLSNPEQVIPTLAARLHMDVYEAVLSDFHQRIPQIFESLMTQRNVQKEAEDTFFGAFPKLREHKEAVFRFATAFRQVNPQMPREDFSKQLGLAMMASLGIPFDAAAPAGQPAAAASAPGPVVVARDVMQAGGGFTPAPTGTSAPLAPNTPGQKTVYEQFADDLLADDRNPNG